MADLDLAERLIAERYSVPSVDGLGPFPAALAAARAGDLGPLREALAERNMYRWTAPIEAALAGEPEADPEAVAAAESEELLADEEPEADPEISPSSEAHEQQLGQTAWDGEAESEVAPETDSQPETPDGAPVESPVEPTTPPRTRRR